LSGVVAGTDMAQQYESVTVAVFEAEQQFDNIFLDTPASALESSKKNVILSKKQSPRNNRV
jgi:hypothetical protein